ncbi:MAG: glycine--tRNA ligase [Patescibacteria group bacterium]
MNVSMEQLVSLTKRRGFIFPGSDIYGGLANSWDYGPLGVELKNNIKNLWWERFVRRRDDIVGLDTALLMNTRVWEASGHLKEFSDPLVECKKCHERFRADSLDEIAETELIVEKREKASIEKRTAHTYRVCPNCHSKDLDDSKQFNLMLKTFLGPVESNENIVYFRPETAQGMFVNFKNVLDTTRKTLPFGIAQIGKAFRNEITPGNFIFRTREFEQMEIEYFVHESDWKEQFEHWKNEMTKWMQDIGLDMTKVHEFEQPKDELAHYSKRTMDFEFDFPFGKKELYGLAYRTDFDLKNHYKEAPYREEGKESSYPHVIEPTWGVDRTVLAVLTSAYEETEDRIVLKLDPKIAPYKAAVFPLLKNKPELVAFARKIYEDLRKKYMVAWDERGNIGKRYYAQDEIGTPHCITVDFESLENQTVTVRDRDTMEQKRVPITELDENIGNML